jgi:hypothetical protein
LIEPAVRTFRYRSETFYGDILQAIGHLLGWADQPTTGLRPARMPAAPAALSARAGEP